MATRTKEHSECLEVIERIVGRISPVSTNPMEQRKEKRYYALVDFSEWYTGSTQTHIEFFTTDSCFSIEA